MRKTHIGYKLLTQELTTHNNTQWKVGVWKKTIGEGNMPCSKDVLHYYPFAEVALFLNPIHADITNPRLFKIECSKQIGTDGLKAWCKEQKLIEEISIIVPTTLQRVAFAIFVAMPTASSAWKRWANKWLSGVDRTANAAYAANAANAAEADAFPLLLQEAATKALSFK